MKYNNKVNFQKLRFQFDGNVKVGYALTQIKGIGKRFAQAIVNLAEIDPNLKITEIPEEKINEIEKIILNPIQYGIPNWMVNRKKDLRSGEDLHIIGNRLEITVKRDIDRLKRIRSYKGVRHRLRLKVRGIRNYIGRGFHKKNLKLEKAIEKINSLMQVRNTEEITMERQYLAEIFDKKLLEYKKIYNLNDYVISYLLENSIGLRYEGNFITFFRLKT